ncbi:MAG: hypothetical protein QOG23_3735 [Blastocatellia bacterium]|nr:hypothetical protein [Blastocatellia bacterium]
MAASRRYRSGFCNRALPDGRASAPNTNAESWWTFSSPIVIIAVMKLRLIVEKDSETGRYSSVFPELPGCASAGDTEDEAIANAKEALELWFEPAE